MKKYLVVLLSSLLILASFPITTLSDIKTDKKNDDTSSETGKYYAKDEVIYVNLDASGHIENMYVVNSFQDIKAEEIVDYGDYINVRNLTDLTDIDQVKDEVHFQADTEEFYYQGELTNTPLPWDLSITYMLDGKEIQPDQLAGQSGDLEIRITTSANETVNPLFFEYYLLQISLTFDPLIFHDIQAPKGTIANEGKNKLINFSVMPEQEEVLIVSAHVKDLKIEPIQLSAIPANLAIEDPDVGDMTDDMKTLSDAIREIHSGIAQLGSGTSELHDGASELSKGSEEYLSGIQTLDQSSDELISGSKQLLDVMQFVSDTMQESPDMPDLDDLKSLPQVFRDMAKEFRQFAKGLHELNDAINNIPDNPISDETIGQIEKVLRESGADDSVLVAFNQLVATYYAAQAVKELSQDIPSQLAKLAENMADHLDTIATDIEDGMENFDQLDELSDLQNGLTNLSSEYQTFHNGLVDYTDGVSSLASSYQTLNSGIHDVSDGTSSLESGVRELHDGTKELQEATSDLPDEMQTEIEKFMEEFDFSDFEPTSFVSTKNKNIGVVQFVLQTETIEKEEPETTIKEEEEKKGIWDRFLDLFR